MDEALTTKKNNNKDEEKQSCWEKRSKKERRLIILVSVVALVLLILLIVVITYFASASAVCFTSSCVKASSEFLKYVRPEVNPCDDFYQFACGNFANNVHLEQAENSVELLLRKTVKNRIQSIIEEPVGHHDFRPLILAKNLYKACLNLNAIDLVGVTVIQNALNQIGGWPILEGNAWNDWNFEWKLATYKLRELGYNYQFFIALDIVPDVNDPTRMIIKFSPPDTPLRGATDDDEELFFEYMVNISVAFGANRALAKSDFRDVIDFQKSLFLNLPEDQNRHTYDPLTISELRHKFSDIPWMEYINRLIYPIRSVSYDQTVEIKNEGYFRRLQNALRHVSKRVVANYIAWRTVRQQSVFLTSELSDLSWNYYSTLTKQAPPTASKKCSDLANYVFPLPLQAQYVKRFLSSRTKANVEQILKYIKRAFTEAIRNLDWIDEETRLLAFERIAVGYDKIAYPNALLDPNILEEYYKGVEVDQNNFFQSMLQANFFAANRKFQRLHEPINEIYELERAVATSTEVSYSATQNSINLPAGVLQGVMYDDNRPQCLNYGALGSSLGHEVFHTVFEGKGLSADAKQYEWLSTRSLLNYDRKLACIEHHYGEYFLTELGKHLNSSNTRNEDAADVAGVKIAYNAYRHFLNENGAEQNLPGFDYTSLQLFWISSALRFCSKETNKSLASTVAHAYHSPPRYRVIGALRNLEEFSRDFGCSASSYMYNKQKCSIL